MAVDLRPTQGGRAARDVEHDRPEEHRAGGLTLAGRALHAEWTKLRTVSSTGWLLVATVAAFVVVSSAATAAVNTSHCPSPTECYEDTTELSLTGVWMAQAVVVVLAVLVVSNEYGTGMIRTTLTALPRRSAVLLSKAGLVLAMTLGVGTFAVSGSLLAGRLILPGNGFTEANGYPPLSLADGPTLRAAAGTVLYLALVALMSLGIALAVRDTAAAITYVLGLLYVFPVVLALVSDPVWHERLQKLGPMTAGLSIQATRDLDQLPIQPWPGMGVMALYAGASLGVGAVRLLRPSGRAL